MGLHDIYSKVEDQLHLVLDSNNAEIFQHYHTWNDQFSDLLAIDPDNNKDITIPFPAVFFEVDVKSIEQQGNNCQLMNLEIKIHIAHQLMDAGDGEFEQNWIVFDVADTTHSILQICKPDLFSQWIRTNITQDFNHGNLYHLILTYVTTYQDNSNDLPIGGYYFGPVNLNPITKENI